MSDQPENNAEHSPAARQAANSVTTKAETDAVAVIESASATLWSAPIPPPADMREYNDIVQGAAERILGMAERQAAHRVEMEKDNIEIEKTRMELTNTIIKDDSYLSWCGLIFGFVISMTVIGGGIYLIDAGHDWAGAILVGINIIGLAGIFVYGSRRTGQRQKDQS